MEGNTRDHYSSRNIRGCSNTILHLKGEEKRVVGGRGGGLEIPFLILGDDRRKQGGGRGGGGCVNC